MILEIPYSNLYVQHLQITFTLFFHKCIMEAAIKVHVPGMMFSIDIFVLQKSDNFYLSQQVTVPKSFFGHDKMSNISSL